MKKIVNCVAFITLEFFKIDTATATIFHFRPGFCFIWETVYSGKREWMDGLAFSQKKVSSKENERKGSKIGNKSRHVSDGVATLTFDNSCRKSWPVLRMKKCLNLCCKWHSLFLIFLSDVLAIGLFFFEALRAISRPLITKQKGKVAVYHRF